MLNEGNLYYRNQISYSIEKFTFPPYHFIRTEIFIYKVATLLKNVKTQYKICIFLFCVTNIQENHKTRALFFTNGSARTNIINCRRLCLYVYDCLERIDRESLELVCFFVVVKDQIALPIFHSIVG